MGQYGIRGGFIGCKSNSCNIVCITINQSAPIFILIFYPRHLISQFRYDADLNIEYLFLSFCLSHRMQNFLRLDWPSVQRRKQWLLLIKWIKLKEKEIYQTATSRSRYFYSITRIVALTQRRKMRDRPKVIVRRDGHEQWLAGPFLKTGLRLRK